MVDLQGKDKRNISLPMKLQSYEYEQAINKPTIINTQRTFYNIRIADIDNRINRLKDRNEKLLKEIENTDELVITLDAETADEIATLTKQVNTQNSRIENLKNNINKIEKDRTQVKETHRDNIKLFKERYTKKKIELVSQIKILSAKINSLENFKKVQNILQEKLEGNKERMIKYEKELKETTEGIRRKFEFDKEMLKIELYNYLLDLAAHFQIETNKFMSFPNKRLMQENIMLQKNLLQLSKEVSTKRNVAIDCQNIFESHRKTIVAQRSSTKHNMVTLKIYNRVLKALQRKFDKMKKCLSIINIPESTAEERQWLAVENARIEEQNVKFLLSSMQTLFHKEKTKIGIAKYLQRKVECKIKAVIETLYDVKYIVICLLKCPATELSYSKLLLIFQDKLFKGQLRLQCNTVNSVESIPREIDCHVEDLKDIPEDINFEISSATEETALMSRAILDKTRSKSTEKDETDTSIENDTSDKNELDEIFKDLTVFDENEYEEINDAESLDGEELLDVNEE